MTRTLGISLAMCCAFCRPPSSLSATRIGCHTLAGSEPFFRGTQEIEKELLQICAEEILGAEAGSYDGYVSSGGTESNIQALWIFRNRYILDNCVQEADQADPDALENAGCDFAICGIAFSLIN